MQWHLGRAHVGYHDKQSDHCAGWMHRYVTDRSDLLRHKHVHEQLIATACKHERANAAMKYACRAIAFCALLTSCCVSAAERFSEAHEWCIKTAAATYYQSSDPISFAGLVDLIHALMGVEAGCGLTHLNDNRTVDYGCMQINSSTLNRLASRGYGFNTSVVQFNDCQNIMLGTWVIESELKTGHDVWTSIGNYNSHTQKHNRDYQLKVWHQLQLLWANRIAGR